MTITRLGQLWDELYTTQGVSLFSGSTYPAATNVKQYTGGYAYRTTTTASEFGISFATTTAVRAGVWLNHNSVNAAYRPSLVTIDVGDSLVRVVYLPTTNKWRLHLGYQQSSTSFYTPVSDTAAGTFSNTDVWRHIGVTYKCDDTSGFFSLYMDGAQILNYTGDTTVYKASSASKEAASITGLYVSGYEYLGSWSGYAYWDDFYCDSIVGESDAVPPAKRFLFSLAAGAGANTNWTPLSSTNISNVDDAVGTVNDGDTTYVKAATADVTDTYTITAITVPADHVIRAAIPVAIARKTDAVDCQLSTIAYDGANTTTGAAQALTTAYAPAWARMATQPDSTAWNETDFEAMEFGFKSAGTFA